MLIEPICVSSDTLSKIPMTFFSPINVAGGGSSKDLLIRRSSNPPPTSRSFGHLTMSWPLSFCDSCDSQILYCVYIILRWLLVTLRGRGTEAGTCRLLVCSDVTENKGKCQLADWGRVELWCGALKAPPVWARCCTSKQ